MMERARALVGRHRTEAVTATMFEVISAEERTRWDRGERQGFAHYAPLIMPGRIIVHLFRLDQGLRRRAGL